IRRCAAQAAGRLRRLCAGGARGPALLSGHAPPAELAAPLRGGGVPAVHVGRRLGSPPANHAPGAGLPGGATRLVHGRVRHVAVRGLTSALLLDALGTLVELKPPAPRLQRSLGTISLAEAEQAMAAEMSYY